MRFHLDLYIVSFTIDFLPGLFPHAGRINADPPSETKQEDKPALKGIEAGTNTRSEVALSL